MAVFDHHINMKKCVRVLLLKLSRIQKSQIFDFAEIYNFKHQY